MPTNTKFDFPGTRCQALNDSTAADFVSILQTQKFRVSWNSPISAGTYKRKSATKCSLLSFFWRPFGEMQEDPDNRDAYRAAWPPRRRKLPDPNHKPDPNDEEEEGPKRARSEPAPRRMRAADSSEDHSHQRQPRK